MALYKLVFSPTGRTAQAAAALATRLGNEAHEVDLCAQDCDVSGLELGPHDICVVAVPCFGGRVPPLAAERLQPLRGNGASAALMVSYGNRDFEDALVELQDILEERGFRCVAGVAAVCEHSIFRTFATYRPGADDLKQLRGFSLEVARLLVTGPVHLKLELPGKRPYRELGSRTLVPHAVENCTRCATCVPLCPAGAIPAEAPQEVDEGRCIGCMRCVEVCPHGVRKLDLLTRTQLYRKLQPLCATPKLSELWLATGIEEPHAVEAAQAGA